MTPFVKTITNRLWNRTNTDDSILSPPDELYECVDHLWQEYMYSGRYRNFIDFETYVIKNIRKVFPI